MSGTHSPQVGRTGPLLSRRTFILTGTGAALSLWLPGCGAGADPSAAGLRGPLLAPPRGGPTFSAQLIRREDLLRLRFHFWNLALVPPTGPEQPARLSKVVSAEDSYLVVELAPQHLNEEAFLEEQKAEPGPHPIESQTDEGPAPPPVRTRLAGSSRLAFVVPPGSLPLDYTTENLLRWAAFTQRVVPNALPRVNRVENPSTLRPVPPNETQTAIELPWHLLISPHSSLTWANAVGPVSHTLKVNGGQDLEVYELWHTRLAVLRDPGGQRIVDEFDDAARTVRAVWALDKKFATNLNANTSPVIDDTNPRLEQGVGPKFRQTVDERDRYDIVRLSSDFGINSGKLDCQLPPAQCPDSPPRYMPQPIDVRRLMLTSLGGWIDARGAWDLPQLDKPGVYNSSLLEWRHRGTMGRDHYVRIVRKGYLFPFGHRAALIKISERKFERVAVDGKSERGAYLRQRTFIVVREPVRSYDGIPTMPHQGRKFPFRTLRCTTLVTPILDVRQPFAVPGDSQTFVAEVGGQPYPFSFVGTDWAGRSVDFTCPIVFAESTVGDAAGPAADLVAAYYKSLQDNPQNVEVLHERFFDGQKVVVAPTQTPGDTTLTVTAMRFGAQAEPTPSGEPDFYPTVDAFEVALPEAAAMAGKPIPGPVVKYFEHYVLQEPAFASNPGQVFLESTAAAKLGFDTASSGGVITPNFTITALSRSLGPVGGKPGDVRTGTFLPADVFDLADAKLLGGIRLSDLLPDASGTDRWPALVSTELADPRRVETVLAWRTRTQPDPLGLYQPMDPGQQQLKVTARIVTFLDDPERSTFSIDGELARFVIHLFGTAAEFIRLDVNQLRFTAARDQKPDVDVDIGAVTFHGPLRYLAELATHMDFADGSGLSVEAAADAIGVNLGFSLPTVPAGVLTLKNLAFSAGVTIPYDGSPVRARFAFSSREDPFTITVLAFGGSGFVAVEIGADGVELLEFALGAGGGFEVSVAVASGRVELMAGFYFCVETLPDKKQQLTTTLYVDLEGEVEALGIVSVSLELHIALSYISCPEALEGQASMTASIEVCGVGDSVTITVRKRFAGSGSCATAAGAVQLRAARVAALPAGAGSLPAGPPYSWGHFVEQHHWERYVESFAPVGG